MKLIRIVFTAAMLTVLFFAFGCGSNDSGSGSAGVDSITIDSITPSIVSAGTTTTFSISVSYSLQTKESGVINYGFSAGSSYTLENDNKIVSKGTGTASFSVIKTLNEINTLRVLLSENPHSSSWSPLVSTEKTITVN